jgi:GNAT superfamily N-acetyltransferase
MLTFTEKKSPFYRTLKAELDGQSVGRVDFEYNPYKEAEDGFNLIMVYVNKEYRRQGIATKMLKHLQDKYGTIHWNGKTSDGESLYKSYYSDLKSS